MEKRIEIIRGGCKTPLLAKFDNFDSVTNVYNGDNLIGSFNHTNTDFYNGYNGGILAEGKYYYICGLRKDTGVKVLYLTNKLIHSMNELCEYMREFHSLIPNPNHEYKKIITQVLMHSDGINGGWSHGCITIYPILWKEFISLFEINNHGTLELKRNPTWKVPSYYQGFINA